MQSRTQNHFKTIQRLVRARRRTNTTGRKSGGVWEDINQDTRNERRYSQDKHKEKIMARAWKEKYRTVAIPMENYEMLSELADEEGRSLTRQISWLIKKAFEKKSS